MTNEHDTASAPDLGLLPSPRKLVMAIATFLLIGAVAWVAGRAARSPAATQDDFRLLSDAEFTQEQAWLEHRIIASAVAEAHTDFVAGHEKIGLEEEVPHDLRKQRPHSLHTSQQVESERLLLLGSAARLQRRSQELRHMLPAAENDKIEEWLVRQRRSQLQFHERTNAYFYPPESKEAE